MEIGLKQIDAVTLLVRFTRSSATFQSRRKMTRRAGEREISSETFRDRSLSPKMYCFNEALEQFNSDEEPPHHSESVTSDNNIKETAFFNNRDEVDILPVLRANHSSVQKPI